ncbi:MAG TPA: VOC family protein [Candidatus Saccharimonadales bacterium]|jgi:predicted 3-demethylubiquinone-9 3-methyltransferase (glyoxalase superfamily)
MAELQKITPNLWFDGNAKEAAEYYVSVFPDSEITTVVNYPTEGLADFQKDLAGKPLTVVFTLAGMQFVAINAGPEFKFNESVSFSIGCADQAEIDHFWDKLSKVPESEQCGWCKDQFGLSWQVVPADMDELMSGDDGAPSPEAYGAMMQMKKIDVAAIKAAAGTTE